MNSKSSIFLSYNWAQTEFADKLERTLGNVANIVRDHCVSPWSSLTEFMKTIRKQDFAVLMISDEYLKSVNCMFEVSQLMRDDNWTGKVMFAVFPNAKVYDSLEHQQYVKFWQQRRINIEAQIESLPKQSIEGLIIELKKIDEILLNISQFLTIIKDFKNPKLDVVIEAISKKVMVSFFDDCRDFNELFQKCIETLSKITNTDYNQIILSAKTTSHSTGLVVFADKIATGKQKYRIVEQSGLIATCYATGNAMNCPNTQNDENYFMAVSETAAEIVIPIMFQNKIVGVFNSESEIRNYYSNEMIMEIESVCANFSQCLISLGYRPNTYFKLLPYISL